MKTELIFKNQFCKLVITPEDDWEKKLLGAVAKEGNALDAEVTYSAKKHFSYGECESVEILLCAKETEIKK